MNVVLLALFFQMLFLNSVGYDIYDPWFLLQHE